MSYYIIVDYTSLFMIFIIFEVIVKGKRESGLP